MFGRDGDVVEEAEALGLVEFGVMAGRPDQGQGIARRAAQDGVRGLNDAAGRQQGRLERPGRRRGVLVQGDIVAAGRGGDVAEILVGVDGLDFLSVAGRASILFSGSPGSRSSMAWIASSRRGDSGCPGPM